MKLLRPENYLFFPHQLWCSDSRYKCWRHGDASGVCLHCARFVQVPWMGCRDSELFQWYFFINRLTDFQMPQLAASGWKLIMVLSSGFSRNTHEFLFTCLCDTVAFRSASSSGSHLQGWKPQCVWGHYTSIFRLAASEAHLLCFLLLFLPHKKYLGTLSFAHTYGEKMISNIWGKWNWYFPMLECRRKKWFLFWSTIMLSTVTSLR